MVTYVWEVDESKPRMWKDGHEYRFNSQLTEIIVVSLKRTEK